MRSASGLQRHKRYRQVIDDPVCYAARMSRQTGDERGDQVYELIVNDLAVTIYDCRPTSPPSVCIDLLNSMM